MAAKQQVKRRAKTVKRIQLQKKYKSPWQSRRTRNQKKPHSHLEHRAKHAYASNTVSSKVVRFSSPKLFASKMVRQMLKAYIEAKARSLMKTLLTDVYDHVATEVENLSQKNELSDLSGTDVQAALKEAMTKELAKHSAEPTSTECA
ncbi:histone H2B.v3-like [Protobothrops mucrosquamatus]|uniref:histone H2B.v3-like n=1 Tax=Protobothrops mucrosquamatus TaxID=103944 RepID=UPI0010FAD80C|nr:histone H2B.v3-like [Protobothrops mucrosquamatus]